VRTDGSTSCVHVCFDSDDLVSCIPGHAHTIPILADQIHTPHTYSRVTVTVTVNYCRTNHAHEKHNTLPNQPHRSSQNKSLFCSEQQQPRLAVSSFKAYYHSSGHLRDRRLPQFPFAVAYAGRTTCTAGAATECCAPTSASTRTSCVAPVSTSPASPWRTGSQ
jgi:hypothetical protein